MDDFKVKFSDAVKPALIISLIIIALSLIIQFLVNSLETQKYIGYVVILFELGLLIYFGIQYRDSYANGSLTYGQSFTYLFYLSIILSLAPSIFYYGGFYNLNHYCSNNYMYICV